MDIINLPPLPVPAAPKPQSIDTSSKTVTELAKEMAPQAILTLRDIANDPEEKGATRVAAANAIIDRAEGKVGIMQGDTTNYTVIINQINRVMGKAPASPAIDVTPDATS